MSKWNARAQISPGWLFTSFLGTFDIKLGVTIISLFALLNKVAGVYGIIAVLVGGSFAQISMYLYSITTLFVLIWGLKGIAEENPSRSLLYAHLFLVDHIISTLYLVVFGVEWFVYEPHDGRREAKSEIQKQLQDNAHAQGTEWGDLDPEARIAAAEDIWRQERGFALVVLVATWFVKIYFIAVVYSYALHLRRGSYTSLPKSQPPPHPSASTHTTHRSSRGYAYSHVRNFSTASSAGDNELLWEGEDDDGEGAEKPRSAPAPGAGVGAGGNGGPKEKGAAAS